MLGELTATMTDYKAIFRDTAGHKTLSSLTTEKETATTGAAKSTNAKPLCLPEEPEGLEMNQAKFKD